MINRTQNALSETPEFDQMYRPDIYFNQSHQAIVLRFYYEKSNQVKFFI